MEETNRKPVYYKTVVISDVHLGAAHSKVEEACIFLERVRCRLLILNGAYNRYRMSRGKPYFSLSQAIKHKVKQAVSFISGFESMLADLARSKGCDGVICGHIHYPEDRMIGDVRYLNSGDWVESLSALTEEEDGTWKIVSYRNS